MFELPLMLKISNLYVSLAAILFALLACIKQLRV